MHLKRLVLTGICLQFFVTTLEHWRLRYILAHDCLGKSRGCALCNGSVESTRPTLVFQLCCLCCAVLGKPGMHACKHRSGQHSSRRTCRQAHHRLCRCHTNLGLMESVHAGFHSAALYEGLRASVAPLVALLRDDEDKTRANAAGALGNLVRNSGLLCQSLIQANALQVCPELPNERDANASGCDSCDVPRVCGSDPSSCHQCALSFEVDDDFDTMLHLLGPCSSDDHTDIKQHRGIAFSSSPCCCCLSCMTYQEP